MGFDLVGYGYAVLVASGGIIGFVKAGSIASLVAGLLFGVLAGVGAYRMSQNSDNFWVSLGTSGTLAAVMGVRFLNSWKFLPAGLMAGTSVLVFVRICVCLLCKPGRRDRAKRS
ncbi:transmembrane protein 14C-like [Sardina pilchardus]|uniref:transmembrane protein 14C-like n=1 Tax=Sardina pilchardus TaxID=27697 RepID=UPI002E15A292